MKQSAPPASDDELPTTSDDAQEKRRRSQIPNSVRLFASWPDPSGDSSAKISPMSLSDINDKFTSPSRDRLSPSESKRRMDEKQSKAQEVRDRLLQEKAQKHKEKAEKSQAIRARQEEQQQQKLAGLTTKLQKAEELRNQQITKIKKTAHEQELKVDEIHFINKIESELKKDDVRNKEKDVEARLQDLHEERKRRKEEKAAREAAAEERKKVLEAEDQAKIELIREKIREKDQKIEQQMMEKEKERIEHASHKQKEREKRLSAINAANLANVVELQKKIREKQEASEKRKQEAVDQRRQKAFELSLRRCSQSPHDSDHTPVSVPYETQKVCSVCRVLIGSEIYLYSHLRGKTHQNQIKKQHEGHSITNEDVELYNMKHIVDLPPGSSASDFDPELAKLDKKRLKSIKKHSSQLKQRLLAKAAAFQSQTVQQLFPSTSHSSEPSRGSPLSKLLNELSNVCDAKNNASIESRVHSFDRAIKSIEKVIESSHSQRLSLARLGGLKLFSQIISQVNSQTQFVISDKSLSRFLDLIGATCYKLKYHSLYYFNSTMVIELLDLLEARLASHLSCTSSVRKCDPVIASLSRSISLLFKTLCGIMSDPTERSDDMETRIHEVISYIVSIGIVDKVSLGIGSAESGAALDEEPELADFLMDSLSLLTCVTALLISLRTKDRLWDRPEDTTQFTITIRMTQIAGVVPLLYGMLLHTHIFSRGHSPRVVPPEAPRHALDIACLCVALLNHVALLDLAMLQATLGSECLSLQLRHISGYLLWYCGHWKQHKSLAHEIIRLLGFFSLTNAENQAILHTGQRPTILQQLCTMPFEYFSDRRLMEILFPTLISCCYANAENRAMLEQEMSPVMLASFVEVGSVIDGRICCCLANGRGDPESAVVDERSE